MPLTPEQATRVVQRLSDELTRRRPTVEERLRYYKGETGRLRFATDEFAQYHADRFAGFSDNWCKPVVDAAAERMQVLGIRLGEDRRADRELLRVWDANDCDRGSSEAFAVFMAAGWAYALVHPAPTSDDIPGITWEHPSQAIVDRDPVTGEIRYGLVSWIDDEFDFATLYTNDEVWKFQRSRSDREWNRTLPAPGGGWVRREVEGETWPITNPIGLVPMVELRNQTLLDDLPLSDIAGVMRMQDAINLVWAYLLNALDYASLPGRVVMGADAPTVPVLDENGQQIGERPLELDTLVKERILWIPAQGASIGEWTAANLQAFGEVIRQAVEHIASQTRTPPHYLMARLINTAAEALTVGESGLVSRTGERITYARAPLRRLHRLVALALGDEGKAEQCRTGTILWRDIQYRSEAQLVDALVKRRQAGYPLQWIAERDLQDPDEVDRMMAMVEAEQSDPLGDRLMREVVDAGSGAPSAPPSAADRG